MNAQIEKILLEKIPKNGCSASLSSFLLDLCRFIL
jgi:hypothetical protein